MNSSAIGEQQHQTTLVDPMEDSHTDAFVNVPLVTGNNQHLSINKLNSMTMSNFEQNFMREMNEAATQTELLTVRDIQKIRSMLKCIYRHVLRLENFQQTASR